MGPKAVLRSVVERAWNVDRLKASAAYEVYVRLAYPEAARTRAAELKFYGDLLPGIERGVVFDVGANAGDKTRIFRRLGARVVAVEPDAAAAARLRARFTRDGVSVIEAGVGSSEGSATFYVMDAADCYNTFSEKWVETLTAGRRTAARAAPRPTSVRMTTLDRLVADHGVPDYVKIDVEGYEAAVLGGLSSRLPLVSIECNLPEFADETLECIRLLASNGPAAFNFTTTEPPQRLASERWIGADEMAAVVESARHPFMEIFCRTDRTEKSD